MKHPLRITSLAAVAVVLFAIAVIFSFAFAVERGHFHGALERIVSARVDRRVRIDGPLTLRLLARHPRVVAREVRIDNPHWMPRGEFAAIDELRLTFAPSLRHPLKVEALELHGAVLRPARTAKGVSNWRLREKSRPVRQGGGLLPLHRLVLKDVRVELRDQARHLHFEGSITTRGEGEAPLRFEAKGELNGRPMSGWLDGEPLAGVVRERPFAFRFEMRSSGSRLGGSGSVNEPFDFLNLDVEFRANGEDLRDLYYLIGLRLPDTGRYVAGGRLSRRGPRIEFRDLDVTTGESDLRGTYVSEWREGRSRFSADLRSKRVRLADLGPKAAGRERPVDGPALLFRETKIPLDGLRLRDGWIEYRADAVEIGPVRLTGLATRFAIDAGRLVTERLEAKAGSGRLEGRIAFDARPEQPDAAVDLMLSGLDVESLLPSKRSAPPVSGALDGTVALQGHGRSPRELASNAKGTIALRMKDGTMRAALAELMGVDLRGIGLALARTDSTVALRCAGVRIDVAERHANATNFQIDTESVVVRGEGGVDLANEAIDLRFSGQPKQPRLRLRTPLLIAGTLAKPSPRLEPGRSLAQGGAAVALGAILTPLAAAAAFIDPGRAKDLDCEQVAAETQAAR
ncbi:MAG: AsmA family protein [Steroidobacteraceae bacterium]